MCTSRSRDASARARATNVFPRERNVKCSDEPAFWRPDLLKELEGSKVFAPVSPNRYRPTIKGALILSPDAMAAALLGALLELLGLPAHFHSPVRGLDATLRRLRPSHVVVDVEAPALRDDAFLGRALMTGARVVIFGRTDRSAAVSDLVQRYGAIAVELPRDLDRLPVVLAIPASGSSPRPPRSTAP